MPYLGWVISWLFGQFDYSQVDSVATPKWIQEILNSYHSDAVAQNRLQALTIKSPDENGYYLDNGVIKYNNHIWWCRCLAAKSA